MELEMLDHFKQLKKDSNPPTEQLTIEGLTLANGLSSGNSTGCESPPPKSPTTNKPSPSRAAFRRRLSRLPSFCELRLSQLQRPNDIEDVLFDLLCDKDDRVAIGKFWAALNCTGLRESDPRLAECRKNFEDVKQELMYEETNCTDATVDRETFKKCTQANIVLIGKAFKNQFVIPDFLEFAKHVDEIYEKVKEKNAGKVADYIPQLSRYSPKYWGVSVCTIDGQRHSVGDCTIPFCLQSCSKPLNYSLAVSDLGAEEVHRYVGQEPSGRSFNELSLDQKKKPHNPMINAGAILVASLLKPNKQIADRFDFAQNQYRRLAGGEFISFSNATYLSERETADRNFALGYYMRENGCFPDGTILTQTLEFYFQLCSIECTAESASVMAATLANGGICPLTGECILSPEAVRNTLSLMHSCGMYDYSGQFAFKVGLPAKSGVAGAILMVVPNVMGICTWSPPLDDLGNSVRGIHFAQEFVLKFPFHNYDNLKHSTTKYDPRNRKSDFEANQVVNLLFAASIGDITAMRRFALSGMDMKQSDYDGRTALHLGAVEGHLSVVKFLIEKCNVPYNPCDRWNFTPIEDAMRFHHPNVVEYLNRCAKKLELGLASENSDRDDNDDSDVGIDFSTKYCEDAEEYKY
ncbi:unnamed protein product [Owenia fusiformis]|uniref:glutaminase n=1 Tax=Owenia fusiformis TaxID=6347 RepID=A0A8J1TPU6_OWEFU|nr:unnamed protein product [Owenia fusiformis]